MECDRIFHYACHWKESIVSVAFKGIYSMSTVYSTACTIVLFVQHSFLFPDWSCAECRSTSTPNFVRPTSPMSSDSNRAKILPSCSQPVTAVSKRSVNCTSMDRKFCCELTIGGKLSDCFPTIMDCL